MTCPIGLAGRVMQIQEPLILLEQRVGHNEPCDIRSATEKFAGRLTLDFLERSGSAGRTAKDWNLQRPGLDNLFHHRPADEVSLQDVTAS
jgi:hypothetical protein